MSSNVQDVALVDADQAVNTRRRPGRQAAAPELIPLLRAPANNAEIPDDSRNRLEEHGEMAFEIDGIAPARGVVLAIALSAPMWLVILLGVAFALR